jgi:hypothetical protein
MQKKTEAVKYTPITGDRVEYLLFGKWVPGVVETILPKTNALNIKVRLDKKVKATRHLIALSGNGNNLRKIKQ